MDWFFGVDMGIYYHPDEPAIIPDGFLSVGVPRMPLRGSQKSKVKSQKSCIRTGAGFGDLNCSNLCFDCCIIDTDLRLSYILWEEEKLPILVLEVVSQTRRGEYTLKKQAYAQLGILYDVIYNPLRKRKPPLEVYQLEQGEYHLLQGEPVWLPAIQLGIGRHRGNYQGIEREWLYWYDESGKRYLTTQEQLQQAQQRARQLEEKLRSLGIDPNE